MQYKSSQTGKREKKTVGACITHLYAKTNAPVKTTRRMKGYEHSWEMRIADWWSAGGQSRFNDSNTVGQCTVIFGRTVSGVRTEATETIINRTRVKPLFLRIQLGVATQLWRAELSLPCDSLPPHLARSPQNPHRLAPHLHCLAIRASLPHNKKITSEIQG